MLFCFARRLDKKKFFITGAGIFSGLTTALFPLTVIKTRMMALQGSHRGLSGALYTARDVLAHDGIRGLYRGFGTVVFGIIPARIVYLGTLESSKSGVLSSLKKAAPNLSETAQVSAASFVSGAMASLAGQLVIVPIDVVSQRLMITGGPNGIEDHRIYQGANSNSGGQRAFHTSRPNGLKLVQHILQTDGIRGLYRGFGASVATFVPTSAIWWTAYGFWKDILFNEFDIVRESQRKDTHKRSEAELLSVHVVAGILTGCTSAGLTNPLDVIKTRLQTGSNHYVSKNANEGLPSKPKHLTWKGTAMHLLETEGIGGFYRGVVPRMANTAIWGTAMVTTYEFLKRLCLLPEKKSDI